MTNPSSTPPSTPLTPGTDPGREEAAVPNTSMRPEALAAPPALPAAELMKRVVDGAHDTIDRLAASAAPPVHRLDAGIAGAGDALQAKARQLRGTRDEWVEQMRSPVRQSPLVALLGAVALGMVIGRITSRRTR